MQKFSSLAKNTRLRIVLTFTLLLSCEVAILFVTEESGMDESKKEDKDTALVVAVFCMAQIALALLLAQSSGLISTALIGLDKLSQLLSKPLLEESKKHIYENALCLLPPNQQHSKSTHKRDVRMNTTTLRTTHERKRTVERELNLLQKNTFDIQMNCILNRCLSLESHMKELLEGNNTSPVPVPASGAVMYTRYGVKMDAFNNLSVDPVPRLASIVALCREIESCGGTVDMASLHAVLAHWTDRALDTTLSKRSPSPLTRPEEEKRHAVSAVKCALRIQEVLGDELSIGVHYGQFYLGRAGCEGSAFSTALGPTVNSTCRLCCLCDEVGCRLCLIQRA